jgi:hypothetical protein
MADLHAVVGCTKAKIYVTDHNAKDQLKSKKVSPALAFARQTSTWCEREMNSTLTAYGLQLLRPVERLSLQRKVFRGFPFVDIVLQ